MGEKDDEILKTLKEILKWIRFSGSQHVKEVLISSIQSDDVEKILIYHLTDGTRSSRQIADIAKINYQRVTRNWSQWARLGIIESVGTVAGGGQRYKKSFDLEDFGYKIPPFQNEQSSKKEENIPKIEEHSENEV